MSIKKSFSHILLLLAVFFVVPSCGTVNRFTRVKKIPREYSLNYCGGEDIKAPKTDLNKEPWIVFSDRAENQSYNAPGGRVKAKDIDYLDAFLVIGTKSNGEYLRLIKYTPDILKNGKLDYKKAEYYGWIPKSKLLLNQQSVTDIASGRKNKALVILTDTTAINNPDRFFVKDSVKLYKDLEFKTVAGVLSPYSIIYKLKDSEDGSMSLVSKKTMLKAETVKEEVLGWISNSLIKDVGTGLYVNLQTVPQDKSLFISKNNKKYICLNEDMIDANNNLSDRYKTLKYNPITSYAINDSLIAFKTQLAQPILDYNNNYIFNVAGERISNKEFKEIAKDLKKINISFVFEGGEQTIKQFPQIVNALQSLQPLFEQSDDRFTYQFNTVMSFDETGKLIRPVSSDFTADYSQILNSLTEKANNRKKLQAIKVPLTSWTSLRKAISLLKSEKNETNLIVLIGDKRQMSNGIDADLNKKILNNNCRIIGFQIYGGEGDDYNNFVLDIEDMITNYAEGMIKAKNKVLVSPEQIKRVNKFTKVADNLNNYRLDFPENSVTQGAVFFPPKSEILSMDLITHNIDTIIQQIKQDNISITQYMSKSFSSVGNNRTKFDSLFVQNYGIDTIRTPDKKLIASFVNEMPAWYMTSKIVVLNDSINDAVDYRLMISESKMKELKVFISSLSAKEVDIIAQAEKKRKYRKPCNCADDDLFAELERENIEDSEVHLTHDSIVADSINIERFYTSQIVPETSYADTKDVRDHLFKVLLDPIKYCKLCKEDKSKLENLTLAEAQYRIVGIPTSTKILKSIKIKDLKDKDSVSDQMLDELVSYYKRMKSELEKAEQFESNGEIYFWVGQKLLP